MGGNGLVGIWKVRDEVRGEEARQESSRGGQSCRERGGEEAGKR